MSDRSDEPSAELGDDEVARIAAYLDGRLSASDARELEDRVVGSDRLAAALYAELTLRGVLGRPASTAAQPARQRLSATLRAAGRSARPRRQLWMRPRVLIPLAAALALLIVLPRLLSGPAQRPPVLRGADRAPVGLSAVGELAAPPTGFQWTSHPMADRYRFRLYDARDELLFETTTREPATTLAPGAVDWSGITRGHWVVTPLAGDGTELTPSQPQRFQLVGP
jgi:hypothetical protein